MNRTGGAVGAPPQSGVPPQQQQQYQQPPPYMMMMPPQQNQPPMWGNQQGIPAQQSDEVRTLWIGDLQYWMDENYINSCFAHTGEVTSVKVIRNKQTGQIEGYGFIEFVSRAAAEKTLQAFNGTPMPNGGQNFRLNWASFSGGDKRDEAGDFTIFVGDLAADVTDYTLQETFKVHYPSVKGAKVVIDRITGRSKGYGFVRFSDESEQIRAMSEMNGALCSTRAMRIGLASNKKTSPGQQQYTKASYQNTQSQIENESDPNNTTIFVGNLDSNVTDDTLRDIFNHFGQLLHVKIPAGKRCGFVQFADRNCAEEALRQLNGYQLSGQSIRLSWGRSPSNKQPQSDSNQYAGYYGGYAQGYESYGYAPAAQDPNMYYGNYSGYGNYQENQQQQQQQPVGYN